MRSQPAKAKSSFDPDTSLLLLFSAVASITILLGWLALRLLLGAGGELKGQPGLHLMLDNCMLLLTSSDPADRLLAYSLIAGLVWVAGIVLWQPLVQLRRTRAAISQINQKRRPLPDDLAQMVASVGLAGRVTLVESDEPLAFCYGALTSRICISTALVKSLASGGELEAVLLHEGYHLRHHDPLKMAVAAALSRAFFFLPVVADLYRHYLAMRELAADQEAVAAQRTPEPLAAALYQLATAHPHMAAPPVAANVMDRADGAVMNARFDALLGVTNPYHRRLSSRKIAVSLGFVALASLLLALTYTAHHGLVLATLEHWLQGYC